MEARLMEKCRNLAGNAARAYRGQHQGRNPTTEAAVDFDPIWASAWSAMQAYGATPQQEDDCRTIFIEGFYSLVPAT